MVKKISKSLYWTPRILSILFITFLALMSLENVFLSESGFWQIMLRFFIFNIPLFILTGSLLISWKYEIVGGITFILAGILNFIPVLIADIKFGFEWYHLAWVIPISGIAFLIGILFLINWSRKKKK